MTTSATARCWAPYAPSGPRSASAARRTPPWTSGSSGWRTARARPRGRRRARARRAPWRPPAGAGHERADEPRVVEVLADLVHLELAGQPGLLEGACQVLAVLPAARVRRVRAGHDREQATVPGGVRLAQRVDQERVPVAVAPQHGQVQPAAVQLGGQGAAQRAVLRVDRAHPAEVPVVVRHLLEPLVRDAPAPRDVAQEGQHVVLTLGPAEADQQHGVVAGAGLRVARGQGQRVAGRGGRVVPITGTRHRSTSRDARRRSMRRPVKNGTSSRTWRRASVARRWRIRSTRSVSSSASRARIHS